MTLFTVEIIENEGVKKVYALANDTNEAANSVLKQFGTAKVYSIEFVAGTKMKWDDYLPPLVTPDLLAQFENEFCSNDDMRDGSPGMVKYYEGWDNAIKQFTMFLQRNQQ